jgi:hypothetical protein
MTVSTERVVAPSPTRTVSKTKYREFQELLKTRFDEATVVSVLEMLCTVLVLDPTMSVYTKERGIKEMQRRKEIMARTGLSSHIVNGTKKYYEKIKAAKTNQHA